MTKKKLIKTLYQYQIKSDEWIDSVPEEINSAFFDNPYIVNTQHMMDACLQFMFSQSELEWIYWFLYDWNNNHSLALAIDGREYTFDDADKLLDFMFSQHLIEE